jgi:hypothetical protein
VHHFTNENCTTFKTEQNDITNEKWLMRTLCGAGKRSIW